MQAGNQADTIGRTGVMEYPKWLNMRHINL
jgi:hypothetical protein